MRWGFSISAVKNKLSGSKAAYAGRMRHLDVMRGDTLYKELGEYLAINPTLAKNFVNGLGGFIESKLKAGYKLDFDVFKIGLVLRGSFNAVNDSFDPTRNEVGVTLSPGVALKKAVAELRPENLTGAAAPTLNLVFPINDPSRAGVVVLNKPCGLNGSFPPVPFTGTGDGVWLETSDGQRVAEGRITLMDATRINCVFDAALSPGSYKLYVGFHTDGTVAVASDSMPVSVVTA